MKYLVMECRPSYAVVLGDDGTYLKVANMRYQVGQTVTDVVPLKLPEVTVQPKANHRRWVSSFGALAACLVLVISSIFFTGQIPHASVYMTINPEVRIDVNRSDVVVGVEGMNADGEALLADYDHKKKELDTVMDELVDRAIDMGYLHEGGKITLSLDGNADWIVTHGDSLNQHLNDHLTDKITVTIDIELKQPEQAVPTAPTDTIVIPVNPDHYGDSDYGDEGESDYDATQEADSGYGQSDYEDPDDGTTEDDGQTDYDDWSEDDGDSEYGDGSHEDDPQEDGQSDYEGSEPADSGYGATDDGESDYTQSGSDEEDDALSDYDEPDDDAQTDGEDSSDYGSSDYGSSEEDTSDYGEEDSDYGEE